VLPNTSSCRKFTDRTHLHLKNRHYLPGIFHSRAQRPRGLRHGSVAGQFLGLQVRIPLSVACWHAEASAMGPSVVQRSPTMCVCVYVRACTCQWVWSDTPTMSR